MGLVGVDSVWLSQVMIELTVSPVTVPAKLAPDLLMFVLTVFPPTVILQPVSTSYVPGSSVSSSYMIHQTPS